MRFQSRFLRNELGGLLDSAERSSDGTLDAADFKKIYRYYGLAVPAILGEQIAALHGRSMSDRERLALTYLGALTGLFDDFSDKHQMPPERLRNMVGRTLTIQPHNSGEKLYMQLYEKALELSHHPDETVQFHLRVYNAQLLSLKQSQPGLSPDDIMTTTIEKGGVSVLFYRTAFERPLQEKEEIAFYKMGGLMQFGNDIFDVYKDARDGVHTIMTTSADIEEVRTIFRNLHRDAFAAFYDIGFSAFNVRRFLRMVSLSLCSRCYVCLDQYANLQKIKGRFDPMQHSRSELICDLDRVGNKWRSVKYHIRERLKG